MKHTFILFRSCTFILALLLWAGKSASAQSRLTDAQLADSVARVADSLINLMFTQPADSPVYVSDTPAITPFRGQDSVAITPGTKPGSGPYHLKGTIKDGGTGEGIPFATIIFMGTTYGASADLDGRFEIGLDELPKDSFKVQALGYGAVMVHALKTKKGEEDVVIELRREAMVLQEFVFYAGEDPALALLKKIIRRKPDNDPDRVDNYRYEVYNKLEVDIQRLSRKQFESLPVPMLKRFSFIYDNLDTASRKTPFLPFFLTETLSDYYFQRDPKKTKEFIKATQVKGIKNESIDQFLGAMYQNVNAYDNFIWVFDKKFHSPISNSGAFYYKYRIKDTQVAYGVPIYLVQFSPRRPGENTFVGDFWVADSSWALQRISMEVDKKANINWVDGVNIYQEYAPVGADSSWFIIKDKFISDFVAPYNAKGPGFIGRKTTSYKKIVVNDDSTVRVLTDPQFRADVIVAEDAHDYTDDYWATARHDTLNKNERAIYGMIDTLNAMPVFRKFKNLMKVAFTGYVQAGAIEFGPYYNVYSTNPVEGQRFRLGIGTTKKLFKDIYINGYLAYGTKDERFKYRLAGLFLLERKPRMYLYGTYTSDVDRSNSYYDEVSSDNIFAVAARKPGIPWKLAYTREARAEFYKSYFSGFSYQFIALHKQFTPYAPLPSAAIFKDELGKSTGTVISNELGLRLRFSYKEKFLEGDYLRTSLGSDYPSLDLRLGVGIKGILHGGYEYRKASLSVSDVIQVAPLGKIYVNLFGGKYFGTLPYPLLEIHPGNEFYYYNRFAFNMMNRFEFVSDQYAGFNIEHSLGGGLFNYVPALKRAKLRQFWTAKGLIGSLNDENTALNLDKGYPFRTLEGNPYVEVGTGIENIFQLFRIDFVWRVTPRPLPDEKQNRYFGIFGSVRFNF